MNTEQDIYYLIEGYLSRYLDDPKADRKQVASDIQAALRDLLARGVPVPRSVLSAHESHPDWDWVRGVDLFCTVQLGEAVTLSEAVLSEARKALKAASSQKFEEFEKLDFESLGIEDPRTLMRTDDPDSRERYCCLLLALLVRGHRLGSTYSKAAEDLRQQLLVHADNAFRSELAPTIVEQCAPLARVLKLKESLLSKNGTEPGIRGLDVIAHLIDQPSPLAKTLTTGALAGAEKPPPESPCPGGGGSGSGGGGWSRPSANHAPGASANCPAHAPRVEVNIVTSSKRNPVTWSQGTAPRPTPTITDPRRDPNPLPNESRGSLDAALLERLSDRHTSASNLLPRIENGAAHVRAKNTVNQMQNAITEIIDGRRPGTQHDDIDSANWLRTIESLAH